MDHVALIGAGREQAYVARHLKRLGYGVLLTDYDPQAPGFAVADDFRLASTYDAEQTAEAVRDMGKHRKIIAVMAIGVDVPLTAATAAQAVGCPHMPLDACRIAMCKSAMQAFMTAHDIPSADYRVIEQASQKIGKLDDFAEFGALGDRVVVKPADSRGARGVSIVSDSREFELAVATAAPFSQTDVVIVEQYLDGPQISGESLIVDGKAYTVGFFDRNYSRLAEFSPLVIEDGAEGPSEYLDYLPETNRLVEQVARNLGIRTGVIKTDLVIHHDRIKVIEFALRVSGGYFGTCAVEASTGIDFIERSVAVFSGQAVDPASLIATRRRGACMRFWFPPHGMLAGLSGESSLRFAPGVLHHELFFRPGDTLPAIKSMVERRGILVAEGSSKHEAVRRADAAIHCVSWDVRDKAA